MGNTFDKAVREEMFTAMERLKIDIELISLVKQLYKSTMIRLEIDRQFRLANTTHWNKTRMSFITIPLPRSNDSIA